MQRSRSLRNLSIAALVAIALGGMSSPGKAEPLSLTIVHVNDWDRMAGINGRGGAAKIASVVSEERARAKAEGGLAIVTFGGDMISPSLLSGIDMGAHMIDLANAIGFDIAVLGNHEFDFGPSVLRERLSESSTAWLAGNVNFSGKPGFPGTDATMMVEKDGYKIGFLGLLTPETVEISSPGEDVSFVPMAKAGAALAKGLKKAGADVVVALTHEGLSADLELLRAVKAIDLVLGGHDHLLIAWYDGRQAIMKAGSQGRHVGVLRLKIDRVKGRRGDAMPVWTPSYDLRSTADIGGDAAVAAKVKGYQERLDRELGAVIGESETELDTRGSSVHSGETAFGNLLADAIRAVTGSDIALTNGGGIRGDMVYPAGTRLTRKLLLTELPFGNKTVKLRLTGVQVKEALENGVSQVENTKGRFPHVSGLAFSFDATKPAGSRVTKVTVGRAALDPGKTYTLATNDFLARGGDGYAVLQSGEILIDSKSSTLMAGQLIDHVMAAGTVSPVIEGRITRED